MSITRRDLRIDTFRAGGKGGQNQNKRDSGVRVTHVPSGAVGESREHKEQRQNRKAAFRRMTEDPRLARWIGGQIGALAERMDEPTRRYTYKAPNISLRKRKQDRE